MGTGRRYSEVWERAPRMVRLHARRVIRVGGIALIDRPCPPVHRRAKERPGFSCGAGQVPDVHVVFGISAEARAGSA